MSLPITYGIPYEIGKVHPNLYEICYLNTSIIFGEHALNNIKIEAIFEGENWNINGKLIPVNNSDIWERIQKQTFHIATKNHMYLAIVKEFDTHLPLNSPSFVSSNGLLSACFWGLYTTYSNDIWSCSNEILANNICNAINSKTYIGYGTYDRPYFKSNEIWDSNFEVVKGLDKMIVSKTQ